MSPHSMWAINYTKLLLKRGREKFNKILKLFLSKYLQSLRFNFSRVWNEIFYGVNFSFYHLSVEQGIKLNYF